jgi:diphosphomevalonate decarboxylase
MAHKSCCYSRKSSLNDKLVAGKSSMMKTYASAIAHPNIALIKYWGDADPELHIPANSSISMNLAGLFTQTQVNFEEGLEHDTIILDGSQMGGDDLERVSKFLDKVRQMAGIQLSARVESRNNFPTGAGIASSASGFAALSLAASRAAGLDLDEQSLSRLARTGSGSACRSVPGGFVEWQAGSSDLDSYAFSMAPPEHWDLVDCIVLVNETEKLVSSRTGHRLAHTSPLQSIRVADAPRRLDICRNALIQPDFNALAEIVELDSFLMHAVMTTSKPSLLYWQPGTVRIIHEVQSMRQAGIPVCHTIDAGPNVHVLCPAEVASVVENRLMQLPGVLKVLMAHPGGAASHVSD